MLKLNGVMIIPTGLGCYLGGDASYLPGVKLISSCVNKLIVNPNAVNASDINEIPENSLYVEGSTIDRFLEGKLNLHEIKKYNKILMAVNPPVTACEINTMNAGIWGLGADINILELNTPLKMKAIINKDGTAGGIYSGIEDLIEQVSLYNFDALAIQTYIDCDEETEINYWNKGGVNPWGGIEAIVSKIISEKINKPVAHGPNDYDYYHSDSDNKLFTKKIVKKTMAPEIISSTFMFCVLKGLHKAPKLEFNLEKYNSDILTNTDIDFLLTPHGCWGRPHQACIDKNIPVIIVKENKTCFSENFVYPKRVYENIIENKVMFVENYLEAAGIIMSMNSGVNYKNILFNKE
jgi:hypothetical protein